MAFDKNMVMSDSLFKIDFEEKEAPMLACPRCGHLNERKPRTVCDACSHFIPHDEARQDWKPKKKKAADLYGVLPEEDEESAQSKDCSFRAGKKSYGWMCAVRRTVILLVMVAGAVAGGAYCMKSYMGEAKWKKLEQQVEKQYNSVRKSANL